jgi:glyoxylase-like metal-dependent hydrolase (beta-lactamase superfamily II)/rhodanese-related sulfurtransferase
MTVERFYLNCLAHASYMIVSEGEAAVIDPQRDVDIYLEYLEGKGLNLRYVIETHLHADFVSGHLELARRTGAEIVIGHRAGATFPHHPARDGEELRLGGATLTIIETPGHTPEGITIAVTDATTPDEPAILFTGDTLFAGDVGRPDLLGAVGITKEDLAGALYDSLHEKVLAFPDDTRVYPAHGAGSSCGKALRSVEFTTIGAERLGNYALKPMTREEFIATITEGQPEAPGYFLADAAMNRAGATELSAVIERAGALDLDAFKRAMGEEGTILLDTRDPETFSRGFIPGAVNIGLDGQFATWVGTLLPIDAPLVVIAEPGREEESVMRCARVGYERIIGYLAGGFDAWREAGLPVDAFQRVGVGELLTLMASDEAPLVLDVRRDGERASKSIPGTRFITLSRLEEHADELRAEGRPIVVQCAGGYRSAMGASILKKHGIADVSDLRGGMGAWEKEMAAEVVAG